MGASSCVNCQVGKFSVMYCAKSGDTCTDCGVGKYSLISGASSNTTCTLCPLTADTCVACPAGRKKPPTGASSVFGCCSWLGYTPRELLSDCRSCEEGTFSSAGSFECMACQANTDENSNQACTPCEPGSFKTENSNQACTPCPIGTCSTVTGASKEDSCKKCPDFVPQSPVGNSSSNDCFGAQTSGPDKPPPPPPQPAELYAIEMVVELPYSRATFTTETPGGNCSRGRRADRPSQHHECGREHGSASSTACSQH